MTLSSTSGLGLGMGDYTGFVVALPKSDLNSMPTQSTILVKVSNSKYSKTYSTLISLASSITSPELASISTPILVNKPQEFQLKYISLGEPSCALISYELNTKVYYIGKIGTDAQTCSSYFKNINTNFDNILLLNFNKTEQKYKTKIIFYKLFPHLTADWLHGSLRFYFSLNLLLSTRSI